MRIDFSTELLCASNLTVSEMVILLVYENEEKIRIKDFSKLVNMSERTIYRTREILMKKGFLEEKRSNQFVITDKLLTLDYKITHNKIKLDVNKKDTKNL